MKSSLPEMQVSMIWSSSAGESGKKVMSRCVLADSSIVGLMSVAVETSRLERLENRTSGLHF